MLEALRGLIAQADERLGHGASGWRRLALDWAAPIAIFVIGVIDISGHQFSPDFPGTPAAHVAFLAVAVVLLGLRRRAPIAAPLGAIAVVTAWNGVMWSVKMQGPFEGFALLVGAAYCVAAGNRRRALRLGTQLLAVWFVVSEVVTHLVGGSLGDLVPVVVWMAAAWAVGVILSRRTEQAHTARVQAATTIAEHEQVTAAAIEQERSRIARELHDVIAHSLSVIVVQAAAERRAIEHGNGNEVSAQTVLESVERSGREALVELRRLLGLLRYGDESPTLAPQPGLARLDELVAQVAETGIDVAVEIDGLPNQLPTGVDLSAYRIVQEALTNVVKHAHATHAWVRLSARRGWLHVDVTDDGHGSPALDVPGGHGLVGMRERVAVYGGTLATRITESGGWQITARLPVAAASTVDPR